MPLKNSPEAQRCFMSTCNWHQISMPDLQQQRLPFEPRTAGLRRQHAVAARLAEAMPLVAAPLADAALRLPTSCTT
jgi:hypothetical protein